MIESVIFDLGGVIVPLDFSNLYRRIAEKCPYTADEIPARIGATGLVVELERGRVTQGDFNAAIRDVLQLQASEDEFLDLWGSLFPPDALLPETLLEGVRRNHRLLLLSNTNPGHFEYIKERFPHMRHFDGYILSYETGSMKPDAHIYEQAILAAACEPQNCFFIDDRPENVDAAIACGMQSVQFSSFEKLKSDFERVGIRWN